MKKEFFGITKNNESIQKFTLTGGGLIAKFINWGAVLQDLKFESDSKSLVLGLEKLEDYIKHSRYFGATAGPYANRIDSGRFRICLLYTSPSPRDRQKSRMPSSA